MIASVAEARPRPAASPASCAVSGSLVAASGLLTNQVINFMVNDTAGTWGRVLGFTADGTWSGSAPGELPGDVSVRQSHPGSERHALHGVRCLLVERREVPEPMAPGPHDRRSLRQLFWIVSVNYSPLGVLRSGLR